MRAAALGRMLTCGAAVLVAAMMTAAAGADATTGAAAARTVVTNVKPTDAYSFLKPAYHVAHALVGGNCFDGSEVVLGADRCFVNNYIYDPCRPLLNKHDRYAGSYCLSDGWSHTGIKITGRHHDDNFQQGRSLWDVQLSSGLKCFLLSGASGTYHGKRVNFGCLHAKRRFLVGEPTKTTPRWHITEVLLKHGHFTDPHRVAIANAWYGVSPDGR